MLSCLGFSLLSPFLATMSFAGYLRVRFLQSALFPCLFVCLFVLLSPTTVFVLGLFWAGFVYLVTTAEFVADQLEMRDKRQQLVRFAFCFLCRVLTCLLENEWEQNTHTHTKKGSNESIKNKTKQKIQITCYKKMEEGHSICREREFGIVPAASHPIPSRVEIANTDRKKRWGVLSCHEGHTGGQVTQDLVYLPTNTN